MVKPTCKIDQAKKIIFTKRTFGQKVADGLTTYAGSWTFIILFCIIIIFWISLNAYVLKEIIEDRAWDPYPFIFLNFLLSLIAAIQAPVILMSQNRSNERDRKKAELDYHINIKAEAEIEDMQKDLEEIKRLIKKRK